MKGLLKLAKSDYKYANFAYLEIQKLSDEADINICAYHLEQCTEKLLKYILQKESINYDRTHDIVVLVDLCLDNEISVPETIDLMSSTITSWATKSRYNSEFRASIRSLEKVLNCCKSWLDELQILEVNIEQDINLPN